LLLLPRLAFVFQSVYNSVQTPRDFASFLFSQESGPGCEWASHLLDLTMSHRSKAFGYEEHLLAEALANQRYRRAEELLQGTEGLEPAGLLTAGYWKPLLLHFARWGHLPQVRWLLEHGANPYVTCGIAKGASTLLQHAALSGNGSLLRYLLDTVSWTERDVNALWYWKVRYGC
jgi:hypothetical protein